MCKKVAFLLIILAGLLLVANPSYAGTSMDYLKNTNLTEENQNNYPMLAVVTRALAVNGSDTSLLKLKLKSLDMNQSLITQGYVLMATSDSSLAARIATQQSYDGSWNNDLYTTAMITYALRESNFQSLAVQNGINYLLVRQNTDGGWGDGGVSSPLETSLAVLALGNSGYQDKIQKGLDWLLLYQDGEGTWGNNINTAWAFAAIQTMGTGSEQLQKAVHYLQTIVNKDGSWGIYPEEAGDPFTTALVITALQKYTNTLPEVTKGIDYINKLVTDEIWISKNLAFYNISEVFYLLRNDPGFPDLQSQYNNFLWNFSDQRNYDYLSRKISLLAQSGSDISTLLQDLLKGQNDDGGWGFAGGYSSDPFDTALVLRALLDAGCSDFYVYQKIISYLSNSANNDGSFSIIKSQPGQIYLTAMVVEELTRLQWIINYPGPLNAARQWLVSQRNASGGYGDGILETARVLGVILDQLTIDQLNATFTLINGSQMADGSWENDSLTTAAVLAVLNKIKPNLLVSAADIVFTPQIAYLNGPVSINVTARNTGLLKADNVEVRLYQGAGTNGVLVDTQMITTLLPKQSSMLTFNWTALSIGPAEFTVVVDPQKQIIESDETDNQAGKILVVAPKMDLTVANTDITIAPDDPGPSDQLIIKAKVHNNGTLNSGAFNVAFYNGDPQTGGTVLGVVNCPDVAGQGVAEVTFNTQLAKGDYQLYVLADSDNQVVEDREDNNKAFAGLQVAKRIDLAIIYSNILLSNDKPLEGEKVTIDAIIENKREENAVNVPVAFYLEDPANGGTLLGSLVLSRIDGNKTALAEFVWNTAGQAPGRKILYVVVDPENTVNEVDKTNNKALTICYINPRPDLTVTVNAVTVTEGLPANLSGTITNTGGTAQGVLVRCYLDDPALNQKIGEVTIPEITTNSTAIVKAALDTVGISGAHKIYYLVDPDNVIQESNETNNQGNGNLTINPAPELSVTTNDISTAQSVIYEGDQVAIKATIRNLTNTAVNNVPIRLVAQVPYPPDIWQTLEEQKINLAGNGTQVVSFNWNSDFKLGMNHLKVIIDPDNTFYERDKSNNSATRDIEVLENVLPDLTVLEGSITTIPSPAATDSQCLVKAEIKNLRAFGADNALVRFYDGNPATGGVQIGADQTVNVIGRGSSTVTASWNTVGFKGCREVYVWIDPNGNLSETNKANNITAAIITLRANSNYQPQDLQANVAYHDVNLTWSVVGAPDVLGYLIWRDGGIINPISELPHGTVKASSEYSTSYSVAKAIDNNTSTYWMSKYNVAPFWFEEEFSGYQLLREIEINWHSSYIGTDYQIQIWTGSKYIPVISVTGNASAKTVHTLGTYGMPVKRYRIYITKSTSNYAGITEVKLKAAQILTPNTYFDPNLPSGNYQYTVTALNTQGEESLPANPVTATVAPPVAPAAFVSQVQGPNVQLTWQASTANDCRGYYLRRDGVLIGGTEAVTGTASASGYYSTSYTPDKALDGNESTYWYLTSLTSNSWWQIDLPESRYVNSLTIKWQYQADCEVLAWIGGDWVKIAEIKDNTQTNNTLNFNDIRKTNKIRLRIVKAPTTYCGIKEVNITAQKRLTELSTLDSLLKAGSYQYSLTADNSLNCESIPAIIAATVNPPAKPTDFVATVAGRDVALSWNHQPETGFHGYLISRNGVVINNGNLTEIAAQANFSASSTNSTSYSLDKMVDRNTSTYWMSGNAFPAWLVLSFDKPRWIAGLTLSWLNSSNYGQDYIIQYRVGGQWRNMVSVQGNQAVDVSYTFKNLVFTDGIKVYCTKASSSYLYIKEIYLYESGISTLASYNDSNLADGNYQYQVLAMDDAGNISEPSDQATATIGAIGSPDNLRAAVNNNLVTLQWNMGTMEGVAGFNIYRDTNLVNQWRNVSTSFVPTSTVNVNNLKNLTDNNNNTYWYFNTYPVSVEMTASQNVDIAKIALQWYSSPAKDFNLWAWVDNSWKSIREFRGNSQTLNEITPGLVTTNKIKIEILAGTSTYGYLGEIRIFDANLVKDLAFTDTVNRNGIYTYQVAAVAKTGDISAGSNQVIVEVNEQSGPAVPTNFTITEQSGSLRLQWSANTEVDLAGYFVYLGNSAQPLNSSILTTAQYNYSIPAGVKDFSFRLIAVDINGNSGPAATADYSISPPVAPGNLKAAVSKRDITLSWNASSSLNIRGYKIYRDGSLINTVSKVSSSTITTSSVYFNNSNYTGGNANDGQATTFWRPGLGDANPSLEIQYSSIQFISAIQVLWLDADSTPANYTVEARVNGTWTEIAAPMNFSQSMFTLPEVKAVDRVRITIHNAVNLPDLAEFAAYSASISTSLSYADKNLSPAIYQYQLSTVNNAGLEGPKSAAVSAEISSRDAAVIAGDVFYTPYLPSVFDNITITLKVANVGTVDLDKVPVSLYVGDPKAGGQLLTTLATSLIKPGEKALLQYIWDPTGFAGTQTIYVVADPQNIINEYDETNNVQTRNINIAAYSNLNTNITNIDSTNFATIKVGLQINDSSGQGVAGLRKENFMVYEDGVRQEIINLISNIDVSTEKAKIDLVFIVDASGSMDQEWQVLPDILKDLTDTLTKCGIDLRYKIYSLQGIRAGTSNVPTIEAIKDGIFRGKYLNIGQYDYGGSEYWGPATAWVAQEYAWRQNAYRIVIPISDECCYSGDPESAEDLESINEAANLCKVNQVEAYPFYGFQDTSQNVKNEMQILAQGSGGEMFYFQDAAQVVSYLTRILSHKKVDYIIEYQTTNNAKDGTLRNVSIDSSYRHAVGNCQGQYRAPQDTYSDLIAESLGSTPVSMENQPVSFTATVKNNGGIPADNVKVQLYIGNPNNGGLLLDTKTIVRIDPNATVLVESSWTSVSGQYQFFAVVDPENSITETNENNNMASLELNVPGTQKPDLLVLKSELTFSTANPACGQSITINARIHNLGSGTGPFNVAFYQGDPRTGGRLIEVENITALDYLGYRDLSCTMACGRTPGEVEIYVVADPLNTIKESDETNNITSNKITISQRALSGNITTDQPVYQPLQNMLLNYSVENSQETAWTGTAKIVIKTIDGKTVQELATYEILDLAGTSSGTPGQWNSSNTWNVDKLSPGRYLACLQLYENGDYFAEFVSEFEVLPQQSVMGKLTTDKLVYAPLDRAAILVDYTNGSPNTMLENLILELAIVDSASKTVWADSTIITYLPVSGSGRYLSYWPVGNTSGGDYQINAVIKSGSQTLWSDSKTVAVDEKAVLAGILTVDPIQTRAGQTIRLDYTIRNRGNLALNQLPVKILFIDTHTESVVKTLTRTHDLAVDAFASDSIQYLVDIPDAEYMVVLQAEVNGSDLPLSSCSLLVDSTPPVTTASLSNLRMTKNGVLYGVTGSELTLTATDNLSGVADTLYDNGSGYQSYSGAISLGSEGRYQVKFKSRDRLNNEENEQTVNIIIDQTPPVIVITRPPAGAEVYPGFTASVEFSDNLGVVKGELYVNEVKYADFSNSPGETVLNLQPGKYTLHAKAVDEAGYETWAIPVAITVLNPDTIPPVTTTSLEGTMGQPGWYRSPVTVTLTAEDNAGGTGVAAIYYRTGSGPASIYNGPFVVSEESLHELSVYAVDNNTNQENPQSVAFHIDQTKPVIEIAKVTEGGIYGPVSPVITILEANPDSAVMILDGNPYESGTPINVGGNHLITVTAMDKAGNLSSQAVRFIVDTIPPVTTITLDGTKGNNGNYLSDVKITLAAEDNPGGSGVGGIYYKLGTSGQYTLYNGPFIISSQGLNELYVYAIDKAGNKENPQHIEIKITKPWSPSYTLLCQELKANGCVDADRTFSNGKVTICGNCRFSYLGTAQKSIIQKGNVKITKLETGLPLQVLPVPDWAALDAATTLPKDCDRDSHDHHADCGHDQDHDCDRNPGHVQICRWNWNHWYDQDHPVLENVRYEKDLRITGHTKYRGLLVVKGDLEISGCVELNDIGIFCTGKVTISGNAKITGLIYAGTGLKICGTPDLNCIIIVNGLAEISGNVDSYGAVSEKYTLWLKKE